jgi:hypothetical protein
MVVYALLIAHLLADFYFQPSSLANGKLKRLPLALLHFAIYAVTLVIPLLLFTSPDQGWKALLIVAGSHCLIDGVRILIEKNTNQKYPILLFATDQALHILIIVCVYWVLLQSTTVYASSFVGRKCSIDFATLQNALLYVLIVLFALLPEAIFVKKLLQSLPQQEQPKLNSHKRAKSVHKALIQITGSHRENIAVRSYVKKATTLPVPSITQKQDQNMGLIIGMLERVLVAVFILVGQYSSIAFVIAAKSIARFKQLEDQAFAEKYLIGTLSSVALAMLTTALLSNFFIVNP